MILDVLNARTMPCTCVKSVTSMEVDETRLSACLRKAWGIWSVCAYPKTMDSVTQSHSNERADTPNHMYAVAVWIRITQGWSYAQRSVGRNASRWISGEGISPQSALLHCQAPTLLLNRWLVCLTGSSILVLKLTLSPDPFPVTLLSLSDWFHGFYPARVRKSLVLKTLASAAD